MLAIPDGPGSLLPFEAERGQDARRLTDVPFDGMNAEGSVGDVRDAQVFAARKQVLDANRDHGPERDLERPAPEIDVARSAGARMEIDSIAPDPDAVAEQLRAVRPQRMGD